MAGNSFPFSETFAIERTNNEKTVFTIHNQIFVSAWPLPANDKALKLNVPAADSFILGYYESFDANGNAGRSDLSGFYVTGAYMNMNSTEWSTCDTIVSKLTNLDPETITHNLTSVTFVLLCLTFFQNIYISTQAAHNLGTDFVVGNVRGNLVVSNYLLSKQVDSLVFYPKRMVQPLLGLVKAL